MRYHFFKGRVALYALLKAFGIGVGERVLLPGYTCVVVPSAVRYLEAVPEYADIDPESYNALLPDYERAYARMCREGTARALKAVLVQHTYGNPNRDTAAIVDWAHEKGVLVIEDCAHAYGVTLGGRPMGNFGDAAFYSTQWSKPFTTGLGGIAQLNNPVFGDAMAALDAEASNPTFRESGLLALQLLAFQWLVRPNFYWVAINSHRALSRRGIFVGSSSTAEMEGKMPGNYFKTMGLLQRWLLARREENMPPIIAHRQQVASEYDRLLAEHNIPTFAREEEAVLIRYPVRVRDRSACLSAARQARVELGDWFNHPLHPQGSNLAGLNWRDDCCPNAVQAAREVINLPVYARINMQEARRIMNFVADYVVRPEPVTSYFLPFAMPDIGEEEVAEVADSLRSGWVTSGPKVKRFEQDFAAFVGGVQAIAVNSATAGLHLALEAIGVQPGDEVITTPYTFTATAEVIRYLGAHPVFVDIDPATFNLDASQIEVAITPRTKAIIPVHFAGMPCDMNHILAIARRHSLKVVEDAAHALPAVYRGQMVGGLASDATVFSFYATKTITTGEGGMVVTRDMALAERCRIMRLHGINRDVFDRYVSIKPGWQYEVIAPGFKYNLTDLAASLGIQQLKKAWMFQRKRAEMACRYDAALADLPLILPPRPQSADVHAWHLYVIRLGDGVSLSRDVFIEQMVARGIGCSVHFIPLHLHPYWRDAYRLLPESYPEALHAYQRAVSLPLYTKMSDADQRRVINGIKEVLG